MSDSPAADGALAWGSGGAKSQRTAGGAGFELDRIVGADQPDLGAVLEGKRAQPRLVGEAALAVDLHHILVGAKGGRAFAVPPADLVPVEIGVAGVEQPALRAAIDG